MTRIVICLALLGTLSGCGLAETATTAATVGAGEAAQAKQAKATEDRVRQQLDQSMQANKQQRDQAEKEAQGQ
jgi:uncharacterized protein YceK